ncbi:STAS domain-containing protein [Nocardioides cavernaquae]|uniref:Anti-sigma factor antagonist n=1 Tax=Nocardioides cavernaquae TaxID=2321396 RepID=A0A3A5HH62_9ACTN|nr:STAS domain-containing protein [Nocardioides cavernaquae]RJS47414.1 anti-sigma factor antagonist [Nocardioides cavernaquae]
MNELAEVEAADLDNVRVVRVSGEIDLSNAHDVLESIGEAVRSGATAIVVDLSGVTFLDSSGISMLFRLHERIGYSRQELRLVVPLASPIRRVLELTRISDVIPLHESLDG